MNPRRQAKRNGQPEERCLSRYHARILASALHLPHVPHLLQYPVRDHRPARPGRALDRGAQRRRRC